VNGRLFNDQDDASFQAVVSDQLHLELLRSWVTDDARPGRNEQWLNALARRSGDPETLVNERIAALCHAECIEHLDG